MLSPAPTTGPIAIWGMEQSSPDFARPVYTSPNTNFGRAAPAEPVDLIATLKAPATEPAMQDDLGPFGPPPAFALSPLQAQRANFPDPPPESPSNAYAALQRLDTPYDTATVDIAR